MAEAGRVGSYKLNICLVLKMTLPGQAPIQGMIANTPGSGLGNGNFLCGVGVVYLYPYSLESCPKLEISKIYDFYETKVMTFMN